MAAQNRAGKIALILRGRLLFSIWQLKRLKISTLAPNAVTQSQVCRWHGAFARIVKIQLEAGYCEGLPHCSSSGG